MSGLGAKTRMLFHQEPIIAWSFLLGGVGLVLPVVVPPIREALGYKKPNIPSPPPIRTLIEGTK